ncbi:PspA-associated protein PspAB [Aeromicrobium sp.]|uniref:PspA-associated protein PspAB n=1 Tax=Aeromicrobium sp. TaxID=1871063 RepID=UPI003D6A8384
MGFLDSILGRSAPPPADLDVLFAVPQAALSLQVAGFAATGLGAVCFRDAEGQADDAVIDDANALITTDAASKVEISDDAHGFRWLTVTRAAGDVSGLVTDLHAANSSLVDARFGAGLLCSTVLFTTPAGGPCALVYLFKQGSFYPFVPLAGQKRDNALELQMRGLVDSDVPVEPKLDRWLALWGAPGLDPAG